MPIRKKGNQLLCTLLIGNTVTNGFLSIFMANLTTGLVGLILSSSLIVVFGEIIPQASLGAARPKQAWPYRKRDTNAIHSLPFRPYAPDTVCWWAPRRSV